LILLTSVLLFLLLEVIYVDRYIHMYMQNLVESRIFSVTLYSSDINMEFTTIMANEDVSATSERH